MPLLSTVEFWSLPGDADLQFLHDLPALKDLKIYESRDDIDFTGLSGLPMETLLLEEFPNPDLTGLSSSPGLKSLTIRHGDEFTSLAGLPDDAILDDLRIYHCDQFRDIGSSACLTGVDELLIKGGALEELNLDAFSSLEALTIVELSHLEQFIPSTTLSSLQRLAITNCDGLSDLSGLPGFPALSHLGISQCSQLISLDGPSFPSTMEWIYLRSNTLLGSIDALSGLESVRFLNITGNHSLGDSVALSFAEEIEILDLAVIYGNDP